MALSPKKANYFRLKHPSKSVDTKYYSLLIRHNWHQTYLHPCISFHCIIRIKASHNNCQNLVSYQTRQHFWTFDAQKYCLGRQLTRCWYTASDFTGFTCQLSNRQDENELRTLNSSGKWVILQNRCHFCHSYTYVEKNYFINRLCQL